MDEFIARGFAATRLDDVAKRAGVAKGTIYLHFKDKESMFEELIRTAIVPLVVRLSSSPPPPGASARDMIEGFAENLIKEVATTRRGDTVYVHVLDASLTTLALPDVGRVKSARLLGRGGEVAVMATGTGFTLTLPAPIPGEIDRVVVMETAR